MPKLKTVTPKAMSVLKESGLLTQNSKEFTGAMLNVATDPQLLKVVLNEIYEDFDSSDIENVDLTLLRDGVRSFLREFLVYSAD